MVHLHFLITSFQNKQRIWHFINNLYLYKIWKLFTLLSNLWVLGSNLAPVLLFSSFVKFYKCIFGANAIDFKILNHCAIKILMGFFILNHCKVSYTALNYYKHLTKMLQLFPLLCGPDYISYTSKLFMPYSGVFTFNNPSHFRGTFTLSTHVYLNPALDSEAPTKPESDEAVKE